MERKAKKRSRAHRPLFALLSRKKTLYSTRRLIEAARARGFRTRVVDVLKCSLVIERDQARILVAAEELSGIAVAVPRIGASVTAAGIAVVRQLEASGVPVVNGSEPIARSRDKLRALQHLASAGVEVPRTVLARGVGDVGALVDQVGGLPAILKLIQGTQGVGVMIAHSAAEVESILSTMWDLGHEILLQEFIAESRGRDVRALVVGERVVGAMRREAKKGEFRSNIHRGAEGMPIDIPAAYAQAAVLAARVLGLDVAGVDLLEGNSGPKVLEVNSSPGFEGLELATGLDIAGAIADHAASLAMRAHRRSGG
ncbi:MAG: RimK family alpha-L-glutamate ligase [Myxococcales bacterium]